MRVAHENGACRATARLPENGATYPSDAPGQHLNPALPTVLTTCLAPPRLYTRTAWQRSVCKLQAPPSRLRFRIMLAAEPAWARAAALRARRCLASAALHASQLRRFISQSRRVCTFVCAPSSALASAAQHSSQRLLRTTRIIQSACLPAAQRAALLFTISCGTDDSACQFSGHTALELAPPTASLQAVLAHHPRCSSYCLHKACAVRCWPAQPARSARVQTPRSYPCCSSSIPQVRVARQRVRKWPQARVAKTRAVHIQVAQRWRLLPQPARPVQRPQQLRGLPARFRQR